MFSFIIFFILFLFIYLFIYLFIFGAKFTLLTDLSFAFIPERQFTLCLVSCNETPISNIQQQKFTTKGHLMELSHRRVLNLTM